MRTVVIKSSVAELNGHLKRTVPGLVRLWRITVASGYGSFLFVGSFYEAEAMRRHKANYEQAAATLTDCGVPGPKRVRGDSP